MSWVAQTKVHRTLHDKSLVILARAAIWCTVSLSLTPDPLHDSLGSWIQGYNSWAKSRPDWPQTGTFSDQISVQFGPSSQIVLKSDLKIKIWVQSGQVYAWIWQPWWDITCRWLELHSFTVPVLYRLFCMVAVLYEVRLQLVWTCFTLECLK